MKNIFKLASPLSQQIWGITVFNLVVSNVSGVVVQVRHLNLFFSYLLTSIKWSEIPSHCMTNRQSLLLLLFIDSCVFHSTFKMTTEVAWKLKSLYDDVKRDPTNIVEIKKRFEEVKNDHKNATFSPVIAAVEANR